MKTVQKIFRFIPKLSVVEFIGLSPSIILVEMREKGAMRESVRKEKTRQVPAIEAPLRCGANLG
jgi:hypothetical protein